MRSERVPPKSVPLVIASHNMHKVREFRTMLKGFAALDVLSLADFPQYVSPEETGSSFEENASLKAMHAAAALKQWVLADDSGLVVPALGGAPGVYSARFAGNSATDLENRKKLLDVMQHLLDEDRAAYFECSLVLASQQGVVKITRGTCEGKILMQERGGSGFGYDPLFVKHEYSQSVAELEESVKNRISHRRKAFDKILTSLELLGTSAL